MYCCNRFLQGPETDPATVKKIREAIDSQKEVTVQLINYTKTGIIISLQSHFHMYSKNTIPIKY